MSQTLFSIRMRSARDGRHISGAERLVPAGELEGLAGLLVRRALEHPRAAAAEIHLTIEEIPLGRLNRGRLPDVHTLRVDNFRQGRQVALVLLERAGVRMQAARLAIERLAAGAAPDGGCMRGAMLMDACDGHRMESDWARGIRASHMDLDSVAEEELRRRLAPHALDNEHVREALVLAAKVLATPGLVAELCWSDDPDYVAGYVASPGNGYQRISHLKPRGDELGGRVFFLRPGCCLDAVVEHLEKSVWLFDRVGRIHPPTDWRG